MTNDKDERAISPSVIVERPYSGQSEDLSLLIKQGQLLFERRQLAGVSIESLAAQTGINLRDMLAIESGLMTLSRSNGLRLATALDVDFENLWISQPL